jgi:hypothetical protein
MSTNRIEATDPESLGLLTMTDAIFYSGLSAGVLRRYEACKLIKPVEDFQRHPLVQNGRPGSGESHL